MPPSTYAVSTTRNGREYAGHSDYPPFPQKELQRLVSRAVDLEAAVEDPPLCESQVFTTKKRAASPTPLDIERLNPPTLTPATNPRPAGVSSPLSLDGDLLTLKSSKKDGSHRCRKMRKGSQVSEARRDTVARSEPPVNSSVAYDSSTFKAQTTGYCGTDVIHPHPHLDIQGFRDVGYTVVPWNGIEALPILDDHGTVYAVFAGRPRAADYMDCCHRLYVAIDNIKKRTLFRPEQQNHRRGNYPAVNIGMSADRGLIEPTNLKVPNNVSEGATRLSKCHEMQRLLNFCDTSFQKWAPNLHAYYRQTMDKLGNHPKYRNIEGAGKDSVFGSMTVNYGSSVVTVPHRDHKNLAFGWCAVVALGNFNPSEGGHLILHEPRLAVEFPPGSAALIPSAVLTHSNAFISPQDQRASVTFYSSGSLFRFVDNGFQTLRSAQASNNGADYKLLLAKMKGDHRDGASQGAEGRWKTGLALYSTLQQLSGNVCEEGMA